MVKTNVHTNKLPWYEGGLHFECQQCGRCCSGPQEGYIWVTKPEIEKIADYLDISQSELRKKYLQRMGLRITIIEEPVSKDCIFLKSIEGANRCSIYPVRPWQCRNWPFWSENLAGPDNWSLAAKRCPGINRGRNYSPEEIHRIKSRKRWWLKK